MTQDAQVQEQAAVRGLLQAVADDLGHDVPAEWAAAFHAAPRHRFLPQTVWLSADLTSCRREEEPQRWFTAAYANEPVVTQLNDGALPPEGEAWASSSASAPSVVVRMLEALDVEDGMHTLEIGTGTGWNAALLAHRLGDQNLVTVEVDGQIAAAARTTLHRAGFHPQVVHTDGTRGWLPRAPYDRIIATCSVRQVPPAWLKQSAPGGVIVTPWDSPWCCYGLLRLEVDGETASGRFSPYAAFMTMRSQRTDLRIFRDVVSDEHEPQESKTSLSPWAVTGDDWDACFALGLRLPDLWFTWHTNPEVENVDTRLWVATTDTASWAAVDVSNDDHDQYTVWQHGPRRLWDEAEDAFATWSRHGRPEVSRFGLTVDGVGRQTAWLDEPGTPWGPAS